MQLGQERCSPTGRDDLFRGIGASKEEYPLEAGHGIDRQIAKVVHAMRIGGFKGNTRGRDAIGPREMQSHWKR